jgi:hypothetical protein
MGEDFSSETSHTKWNAAPAAVYSHHTQSEARLVNVDTEFKPTDTPDDDDPQMCEGRMQPREVICPITGYHVVARRPGQRSITTEEIKEMLEDFP